MTERPILFSDAMVRAIISGAKTQTRRVVTPQDVVEDPTDVDPAPYLHSVKCEGMCEYGCESLPCPYGQPGDRLWVREAHFRFGHWEPVATKRTKTGRQKWRFVADSDAVRFDAPSRTEVRGGRRHSDPSTPAWHTRLARFMPRWASRLTLEVTSVRVERVQSISEEDARAEGFTRHAAGWSAGGEGYDTLTARQAYAELWDSINGKREGCSWDANPWVWVVSFKRVEER